jgi:hypothetical protein
VEKIISLIIIFLGFHTTKNQYCKVNQNNKKDQYCKADENKKNRKKSLSENIDFMLDELNFIIL